MNLLVVDDSKFNLMYAEEVIKKNGIICNIIKAGSGEEALNIILNNNIDIVLLDIIMPKITGLEVLKKIRENGKYREMIIIMFTSITDKEYLKNSFDIGANDYINKPINEIEFISRIKNAMKLRQHQKDLYDLMYVLKEKNENLKKTTLALKRTQSQLVRSEKLSAIGQFSAGIAHEINNPLGYVLSNNDTLEKYCNCYKDLIHKYKETVDYIYEKYKDKWVKEKIDEAKNFEESIAFDFINEDTYQLIDDSRDGIKRISKIIQSLLNFAQRDTKDRMKYNDLNQIVIGIISPIEKEFKDIVNIELNLNNLPKIKCDEVQITEAIYNIIINAVQAIQKYRKESVGNIKISTYSKENFVLCDVWNDGPKIKEEIINKIFDPFFTTKNIGEGMGLGLNICYDIIVNKHNGEIYVESNEKTGTKFTIMLPLDLEKGDES
ncbi:signal transduction histidine kinase [Clostridium tetanomorphum]|uniref:response regulator n=1 Tax=Clostridium tetanomorphum TaxID=1553 RepID=UPI000D902712|nr:response regulator [Clostridium tetanomorphum]MBP1863078.1 signal transduction histidine kinase [Clostridium tetanomorphum]NRS82907.1 signal transduction histidine kinase [Clostridium tetanomorphum]SQC03278.1 response regulator receiver sensor signal transduction histidine kinase [Clostridium tetanomorphum]